MHSAVHSLFGSYCLQIWWICFLKILFIDFKLRTKNSRIEGKEAIRLEFVLTYYYSLALNIFNWQKLNKFLLYMLSHNIDFRMLSQVQQSLSGNDGN